MSYACHFLQFWTITLRAYRLGVCATSVSEMYIICYDLSLACEILYMSRVSSLSCGSRLIQLCCGGTTPDKPFLSVSQATKPLGSCGATRTITTQALPQLFLALV